MATFVTAWSLGDYGLTYDLLSSNSSLRDGLERDEWIEQRRAWADEAHPTLSNSALYANVKRVNRHSGCPQPLVAETPVRVKRLKLAGRLS